MGNCHSRLPIESSCRDRRFDYQIQRANCSKDCRAKRESQGDYLEYQGGSQREDCRDQGEDQRDCFQHQGSRWIKDSRDKRQNS